MVIHTQVREIMYKAHPLQRACRNLLLISLPDLSDEEIAARTGSHLL